MKTLQQVEFEQAGYIVRLSDETDDEPIEDYDPLDPDMQN